MERFFLMVFSFLAFFAKIEKSDIFSRENNEEINNFIISKTSKNSKESDKEREGEIGKNSQNVKEKHHSYPMELSPKGGEQDSKIIATFNTKEENTSQKINVKKEKDRLRHINKYIDEAPKEDKKIIGWNPNQNSFISKIKGVSQFPFGR